MTSATNTQGRDHITTTLATSNTNAISATTGTHATSEDMASSGTHATSATSATDTGEPMITTGASAIDPAATHDPDLTDETTGTASTSTRTRRRASNGSTTNSTELYGGKVVLYAPTATRARYRLKYRDENNKWRFASGGKTRQEALTRAAALVGIAAPTHAFDHDAAPTAAEAFEAWIKHKASGLAPTTIRQYRILFYRNNVLADVRINKITPEMMASINTSGMIPASQRKVSTTWRGALNYRKQWLEYDPEVLVRGLQFTGPTKDPRQVDRNAVPSLRWVSTVLGLAFSTATDDAQQASERLGVSLPTALQGVPARLTDADLKSGARKSSLTDPQRIASWDKQYAKKAARRWHHIAAFAAVGAGSMMRYSEVSALRLRHVLTLEGMEELSHRKNELKDDPEALYTVVNSAMRDFLIVECQTDCKSRQGVVCFRPPKNRNRRQTSFPPFLPTTTHNGALRRVSLRDQAGASRAEAMDAWLTEGTPALRLIVASYICDVLMSAWYSDEKRAELTPTRLQNTLLFPALQATRVEISAQDGLAGYHGPCTLMGNGPWGISRTAAANLNWLFDYASDLLFEHAGTSEKRGRSGYTFHGLRHFGVSLQLRAGRSFVDVAAEAGHATPAFTLEWYAHLIHDAREAFSF